MSSLGTATTLPLVCIVLRPMRHSVYFTIDTNSKSRASIAF